MNLPMADAVRLVDHARDQETEDRLFRRWIPYQGACSFDEFKQSLKPPVFRSTEAILADAEQIMNAVAGGNHGNI